jgi:MFS family permease
VAGSLSSITFLTLTSAVPVWLVRDRGLATDDPLIGWTLAVFSLAAGLGSLLGGFLAPRLGRRLVITGHYWPQLRHCSRCCTWSPGACRSSSRPPWAASSCTRAAP